MRPNRLHRYYAEHRPAQSGICSLQDDMSVANGPGATVRVDINAQLQSLATMNSGAAAPGTTYANQLWADTTNTLAKKRNNANGAWVTFANLDWTQWQLNDGTVGAPAYSFNADPDSGMYRIGANNVGIAVNGAKVLDVATTGLSVTGTLTVATINGGGATISFVTTGGTQAQVTNTAAADRYITLTGAAGAHPAIGTSAGDLLVKPAGSAGDTARFTSGGFFKASSTGNYYGVAGAYHEAVSSTAGTASLIISHRHATDPVGMSIIYTASAPNSTINSFWNCVDSAVTRAELRSNGGLANFQANNVNLSDIEVKTSYELYSDIGWTPKLWNAHKRMRGAWGRFKYADQEHDDWNHGYPAQGVRKAFEGVADELVDLWNEKDERGLLAVYSEDLHNISGAVLTEAQYRIDEHEERLTVLEGRRV